MEAQECGNYISSLHYQISILKLSSSPSKTYSTSIMESKLPWPWTLYFPLSEILKLISSVNPWSEVPVSSTSGKKETTTSEKFLFAC